MLVYSNIYILTASYFLIILTQNTVLHMITTFNFRFLNKYNFIFLSSLTLHIKFDFRFLLSHGVAACADVRSSITKLNVPNLQLSIMFCPGCTTTTRKVAILLLPGNTWSWTAVTILKVRCPSKIHEQTLAALNVTW